MYNGCTKCRGFYLPDGHPCKFPVHEGYVERMMSSVNEACKCIKLPALLIPADQTSISIAAVSNSSLSYSTAPQPSVTPPPLPITTVLGMSPYPMAAVCLPNKSSILGGSDSDLSQDSNDSVSNNIPFILPHLFWHCAIDSLDPTHLAHIHTLALFDHGSPTVLINASPVTKLHLKKHLLPEPFSVLLLSLNPL